MMAPMGPLDDFLARLATLPVPEAERVFKAFVLRLLQREAPDFVVGGEAVLYRFDGVVPHGIGDLIGPTAVEVKYTRLADLEARRATGVARRASDAPFERVLLIHNGHPTLASIDRVVVKGREYLATLATKHLDVLAEVQAAHLGDALLLPIQQELGTPESDWRTEASARLEALQRILATEQVTLFLGAGVSIGAGLQSWDELIGNLYMLLAARRLKEDVGDEAELAELASAARELGGAAPLLAARYLRSGLADAPGAARISFADELSHALYQRVEADPGDLVHALAALCQPRRRGPRVRSVVTFNFDDVLETELEGRRTACRPIFLADEQAAADELPVYHVHGFLPRQRDRYERLHEAPFAFSEEGYHAFYRDPFHWSNIVQLNALRETTCVFVGLSLTDPNLRRLLEIGAVARRPRHFAFLKRTEPDELPGVAGKRGATLLLRLHHRLTEQVLREFDIDTIWYERHGDLPALIEKL